MSPEGVGALEEIFQLFYGHVGEGMRFWGASERRPTCRPDGAIETQSTKAGKIQGSNEIIYDADVADRAQNGIVYTTKNRFKEKGIQLRVFHISNKLADKLSSETKNQI